MTNIPRVGISNNGNSKEFSEEVQETFEKYKKEIEALIKDNYGLKAEDKLLAFLRDIGVLITKRNNELLLFLEEKYGLDFRRTYEFSGGIKTNGIDFANFPDSVKSFFGKDYVRKGSSRGHGYYFNFDGFNSENGVYSLDIKKYISGLSRYYEDIISLLGYFKGKKTSDLNDDERKILIVGLEHYKNLLFFLQNFIISVSDKEYLTKHVLSISNINFSLFFGNVSGTDNFGDINNILTSELEKATANFGDLVLGIDSDERIDYSRGDFFERIITIMDLLFTESFSKQLKFLDEKREFAAKGGKTDIKSIETLFRKTNNRFISRLLRIIREEDNPVKQLFACHNISSQIPEGTKKVDLVGLLYGGIEMPYLMKYVLNRFRGYDSNDISISLMGLSNYSNRNLRELSGAGNYLPLSGGNESEQKSRLQVVLDDNIYYGTSLQVANNTSSMNGPILSGVAEVGLRRPEIGKLGEGSNLSFMLSKIPHAASVTPSRRKGLNYSNMVTKYIAQNLPDLKGKY